MQRIFVGRPFVPELRCGFPVLDNYDIHFNRGIQAARGAHTALGINLSPATGRRSRPFIKGGEYATCFYRPTRKRELMRFAFDYSSGFWCARSFQSVLRKVGLYFKYKARLSALCAEMFKVGDA
jgi:hypothetical protein